MEVVYARSMTFRKAREMDKHPLAAARIRMRYLNEEIDNYLQYDDPVALFWACEALEEICYLIKHSTQDYSRKPSKNTITQDHIDRAEEYPIENLIEFRNGKALAFCHQDRIPTLSLWKGKNKARCFACNKSFGPINVLMERDKMSFLDAVRALI